MKKKVRYDYKISTLVLSESTAPERFTLQSYSLGPSMVTGREQLAGGYLSQHNCLCRQTYQRLLTEAWLLEYYYAVN